MVVDVLKVDTQKCLNVPKCLLHFLCGISIQDDKIQLYLLFINLCFQILPLVLQVPGVEA